MITRSSERKQVEGHLGGGRYTINEESEMAEDYEDPKSSLIGKNAKPEKVNKGPAYGDEPEGSSTDEGSKPGRRAQRPSAKAGEASDGHTSGGAVGGGSADGEDDDTPAMREREMADQFDPSEARPTTDNPGHKDRHGEPRQHSPHKVEAEGAIIGDGHGGEPQARNTQGWGEREAKAGNTMGHR